MIVRWHTKAYRKFLGANGSGKNLIVNSRGEYGQDIFALRSTYFEGRPPKSVNMYWRRFAVSSIPLDDPEKFDAWMRKIWTEKDALMEQYITTGRFPESRDIGINGIDSKATHQKGFIETEVRQAHWWDFLQIFSVLAAFGLVANILAKVWNLMLYGNAAGMVYIPFKA
jgi:hypothetical protein